jgi:bifunctional non-homologous end joining protein LigD
MRKAFEPCIPTASKKVPDRPDWIHEIKQDGYRMIVVRDHDQVKLITRNGHDWTKRYPWIVEAARKIRSTQFVLDGEACILNLQGAADFDDLHSQKHNDEVQLYAFDLLSIDGDDLRELPLHLRKNQLSRLLSRRVGGVQLAPFEQGEIGPDLFKAACTMGLEGIVSKRRDRPYRAGRSPDWLKAKNRDHPAMTRVMEAKSSKARK